MPLLPDAIRSELVRAYTAPERHYHDLRHIETMLALAHEHVALLTDPEAVETAIWFHDAIYDTRRHDNEEKSALLAMDRLAEVAAPDRLGRIASMIRATCGHAVPRFDDDGATRDCALFLDMDLAILGSAPAQFWAYEQGIRREYDWVAQPLWIAGRRKVLTGFLARPTIYASAQFRASHEAQARQNLQNALAALARSDN